MTPRTRSSPMIPTIRRTRGEAPVTRIHPPSLRASRPLASSAFTPEQSMNVTPVRSRAKWAPYARMMERSCSCR
jgi:hypothetical protein